MNLSIETSTTFTMLDAAALPAVFEGELGPDKGGCYLYGRHFNPTVNVLAKQIAAMEGAEAAYCTSSGMSAISAALLQLCDAGDHIVSSDTIYGGTFALLHDFLPVKTGITASFVDTCDLEAVRSAIGPRTRVIYVETTSNPTLRVADLPALAELAHAHGLQLVVDNTFCPLVVSPLQHGADVVVHSLTKFINGASDAIAGAICGRQELIMSLMDLHQGSLMLLGPTMDPQVAYSISMRLPHLGMRMTEHSRRAKLFAERLQERGLTVTYPGLPEHPDHELLTSLSNEEFGYGGIFCVDLGTADLANRFMELLQNEDRFGFMAVSLGYFETLMTAPASSTSSELDDSDLQAAGIPPGLVRVSIGYTGTVEQRWAQLEDVLQQLEVVSASQP